MLLPQLRRRNTAAKERRSSEGSVEAISLCKAYDFLVQDSHYLLRLCQKSKWESIEKCCKIINGIFTAGDCSKDVLLLNKARQQLLQRDAWGNTPLHVICYYKPPEATVEALLEAALSAPGKPMQLLTMMNCKNETPLIIACKSGTSRKATTLLLNGEAVTMPDELASSTFAALMNRYTLIQRVPSLRSRYVELDDIKSKKELTVEKGREDESCDVTQIVNTKKRSTNANSDDSNTADLPAFPYFWNIMEDLMEAAWSASTETSHKDYISHVHGAALVASVLPIEISNMILRTHAEHVDDGTASTPTTTTTTKPLHLAFTRATDSHPKVRQQHAHFVKRLIEMDSSAVTSEIPTSNGRRSVLCQAITSRNHWHLDEEFGEEDGPLLSLFHAYPDSVAQRDIVTGLYPFMLAATMPLQEGKNQEDDREEEDCLQLDTIYNLLRSSPECVSR